MWFCEVVASALEWKVTDPNSRAHALRPFVATGTCLYLMWPLLLSFCCFWVMSVPHDASNFVLLLLLGHVCISCGLCFCPSVASGSCLFLMMPLILYFCCFWVISVSHVASAFVLLLLLDHVCSS
jgi:hypothetical protein